MDLIKIGRYIAGKRKELGLTQRALAEQLGMSDKSVSKWERGVCLPDVSVYTDLCTILGISINEFLAGEDIAREDMITKSEENLIGVTEDGRDRQSRLKKLIGILIALILVLLTCAGVMYWRSHMPRNYIKAFEAESIEMKTAALLAGTGGVYMFHTETTDVFSDMALYMYEYHYGQLINKEEIALAGYDGIGSPKHGTIVIAPADDHSSIKYVIADDYGKYALEYPILEEEAGRSSYGRLVSALNDKKDIRYNNEQTLVVISYDENRLRTVDAEELLKGNTDNAKDNEYVYLISLKLAK